MLSPALSLIFHGAGAKSETGLSSPVPDQQRSSSCVIKSTSLICLLESWRRQPFAGQPKPRRAGRRLRVGLPTPGMSQKMDSETLPSCSFPSTNSSHPRATSHCRNNRINRPAYRRSQLLLHWTSHRVDRDSSSLPGTTRPQPQRERPCSTCRGEL